MRKLRIMSLLLAVLMLVAVFAGCGTTGSTSSGTSAAATEAPAAESKSETPAAESASSGDTSEEAVEPASTEVSLPLTEEPVELTYWIALPGPWAGVIDDITKTSVYQELEKRTGVVLVQVAASGTNAVDVFNVMVAGEEYTDIINSMGMYYSGGIDKAYEDGVAVDLMEYIDQMPNMNNVLTEYGVWKDVVTDSGLLCRAPELDINPAVTQGAMIRSDWLEDLNLEVPETYDELHDVLTAFKNEKNADAALWLSFAGAWANNGLGNGYGVHTFTHVQRGEAPFYQVDGEVKFGPMEEGFKEYTQMLHDWYAEGLVYQDFFTDEYSIKEPDPGLISNGRTGVFSCMISSVDYYAEQAEANGGSAKAIADFKKSSDDELHGYLPVAIVDGFRGDYLTTACENVDLAVAWLDYRYTDEGIFLMNYGIEGEAHEMVDGEPVLTDLVLNNPDGLNTMTTQNLYTAGSGGSVFDTARLISDDLSEVKAEAYVVWDDGTYDTLYAYPSVCTMTTEESEIYTNTYSDIQTYWTETFLAFVTGQKDMSEWDSYIDRLKEMGIQDCIDAKQAALTRYLAR